ncbi:MAG: CmcJ/NvfI family oxidoreductase [Pseudomonadales bacterium]
MTTNNEACLTGVLHFLAPQTQSSLYRNDRVRMNRDDRGNFVDSEGITTEPHELSIKDARQLSPADAMTLSRNGFELLKAPVADYDFLDHQQVVSGYYRDCERIVTEATSARVWAFDHNIRSAGGQAEKRQVKGGQDVQGPAHIVHGDYTLRSGPERLSQLARPPSVNDTLRDLLPQGQGLIPEDVVNAALADGGRFAIINVWRNIESVPVATHPLALCDGQSVEPKDLVVFEIHMPDRVGENYWAKYDERHRFYCYPAMTRDEALLIKQWDSAGLLARSDGAQPDLQANGPCTFSFHSAFHDPHTPEDAPDRWSIEVRCLVVY